ncbi:MAG: hypothetical protein HZC01_00250 [Candidatus Kerfeldbacteria bacterium]|nr:hypothetical protein [Candidatus Kerfeldbacteria bacterium]
MTKFSRQQYQKQSNRWSDQPVRVAVMPRLSVQVLLLGVIVFASLAYLFYMNQTATGGFDIKGIENRITDLQKENSSLELRVAELQSLSTIETASADLQLVSTSSIEYLPAVGTTVAQR